MKILEGKLNGILYEGGFDGFSVDGTFHMERELSYKNNPSIESEKRVNMAYLLLTNPQMFNLIQKSGAYFFHGTNANALPSILKYGINSLDRSIENDIAVNTGEEWSRDMTNGKRNFISLTDDLALALSYTSDELNNNSINELLNFGVLIGCSFEDMSNIRTCSVVSDFPEVGIVGNLPLDHIKFLAVPEDKVQFVKKMVGKKDIEVISINTRDSFLLNDLDYKAFALEQEDKKVEVSTPIYSTYSKDDIKPVVEKRRTFKIREIFESLKSKICEHIRPTKDNERS